MTDLLEQTQQAITKRLSELRPAVEEYERLQSAAAALEAIPASGESSPAITGGADHRRREPGRPRGSRKSASLQAASDSPTTSKARAARKRPARRGRRKRTGGRTAEALALVQGQPGITINELAAKMAIASSYLYRVLPRLQAEGKIREDGRGWRATSS